MHITLVGMSNIGKTHWSNRLASENGFEKIDCDTLVEQRLGDELKKLGYAGIRDVARWMGQPYEQQYAETSRKFIECEQSVMNDIIEKIKSSPQTRPLVIDTTGSVIYTGDEITEKLRNLTHIIYLEASKEHIAGLYERFVTEPKPIIWGNSFARNLGETPQDTLKRCYPNLVEFRARRYAKIAHSIIPFTAHKMENASIEQLRCLTRDLAPQENNKSVI